MSEKKVNPRIVAEAGVFAGLAVAFYLLSPGQLPNAGRISMEMLPLYYLSFRRGAKVGILTGGVVGILIMALDPRFVHPVQVLLDYPVPMMMVGLSGIFSRKIWLGILVGGIGRFVPHFISGIVFFAAFTPEGTPVWLYSLIYNGSYVVPQMVLGLILMPLIMRRMGR